MTDVNPTVGELQQTIAAMRQYAIDCGCGEDFWEFFDAPPTCDLCGSTDVCSWIGTESYCGDCSMKHHVFDRSQKPVGPAL